MTIMISAKTKTAVMPITPAVIENGSMYAHTLVLEETWSLQPINWVSGDFKAVGGPADCQL